LKVGDNAGDSVGLKVGDNVGDSVGLKVGDNVGESVGVLEGLPVVATMDIVGEAVGLNVGGDVVGVLDEATVEAGSVDISSTLNSPFASFNEHFENALHCPTPVSCRNETKLHPDLSKQAFPQSSKEALFPRLFHFPCNKFLSWQTVLALDEKVCQGNVFTTGDDDGKDVVGAKDGLEVVGEFDCDTVGI